MSFPKHNPPTNPVHAGLSILRAIVLAILSFSISTIAAAESNYSAVYKINGDGMSLGKLERKLEQAEDGSYILKTRTYTTGLWAVFIKDTVNEESRFGVADGKIIPRSYHYKKKKKGKLIEERVLFDSDRGIILSSSKDGEQSFPFAGGESDKLLYQFRIRAALRRGERELQFSVVDRMRLRPYRFRVGGLEKLDTPMGKIDAVRVERINEKRRKTTLWFAPGLDHLPVKIVQNAGDHNFSSIIISTSIQVQK